MRLHALAATAFFAIALGLPAAQAEDVVNTNVAFGDLNLSQPADARILALRLQDAAQQVCLKANPETIPPTYMQQCIDNAVSMAMGRIEISLDRAVRNKLDNVHLAVASQ